MPVPVLGGRGGSGSKYQACVLLGGVRLGTTQLTYILLSSDRIFDQHQGPTVWYLSRPKPEWIQESSKGRR